MLIDWFTVIAQLINFLVLVYLLKRFLFGRIVQAMEARKNKITSRIEEADNKLRQAEEQLSDYQQKNKELESKKDELISQAQKEAEQFKQKKIDEMKNDIEDSRQRWKERLNEERMEFIKKLRNGIATQTLNSTTSILRDLANTDLENRIIETFINKIEQDDHESFKFEKGTGMDVTVRSSFRIDDEIKKKIKETLNRKLGTEVEYQFFQSDELICGIELRLNGYKFEWNVKNYISDLEHEITEALESINEKLH